MCLSIIGELHRYQYAEDYLINFITTFSMNLCVCSCKDLHTQKNLKQKPLNEWKNKKETNNKPIINFKNFSIFIFLKKAFLNNNKIIIIKLFKNFIYLFKFKRHGSGANCHQFMSIKQNLTPTVANFSPGGITYVTSLRPENPR